ncbi:MAG: Hsp70 family protein [Myxococcaceae bacterium]
MDFTPLRIRLPFGSEEEFIERYGVHVGRDGFFLATRSPKDVGTKLAFELVLADSSPLLSGEGVVARTVAGARSGMVVRFLRLDGAGAALVDRIVSARHAEPPPAGPSEPPPPSKATTWLGDPTRDVARITGLDGAPLPRKNPAEPPAAGRAGVAPQHRPSVHEAPTWPGDPTRDVVRIAAPGQPATWPEPAASPKPSPGAVLSPPASQAPPAEVPYHLRPTPALGVPEAQFAAMQVHTAVTPVRGIPALGAELALLGRADAERPQTGTEATVVKPRPVETPAVARQSPAATKGAPAEAAPELKPPAPRASPAGDDVPSKDTEPLAVSAAPVPASLSEAIPLPSPSTAQPKAPAPTAVPPPAGAPAKQTARGTAEARTDAAPTLAGAPGAAAGASASKAVEPGLAPAVLGLDVGTTSARMAWAHEGRVELLPGADASLAVLPCRLVRDAHGVLRVLQQGEAEEALWVGSPVTLLGTRADSPAIRTLVRRWPVPVVADERGEVAFEWAGVTVTAVELVAVLLRSLRAEAERRTGRSCTQGVLVVPAAFTLLQRARFREAAERAGLTVLRLLQAPTAAALAFAQDRGLARKRILVWRMGAATCDAAVVAVSGNDLDVVSCGGDGALGGVNFDEQLALGLDKTARTDPARLRVRVAQAERCKQALSTSERGLVPPAVPGEPVIEVSREDLELRTAALVERSVLLAQDILRAAGLSAENIDALVLSGGMAHLPHVRQAVEKAFGKSAAPTDVDGGPALGAALLGAALSAAAVSGRARSNVVEVLAVPLEAVAPEFGHQRAFERNTRLPAEKTLTLTLAANQPLEVQLFQGMARAPDPRSFLGLLQSAGVERDGEWALQLGLSPDGLLQASVTPPGNKRRPLTLQAAPAPAEAEEEADTLIEQIEPAARLLGGLKRLFTKK